MPTYFRLSHADKNIAKALGARYSDEFHLWYAPDGFPQVAQAMAARFPRVEPLPAFDTFPGEDRTFGSSPKLAIDLIPSTCWWTNRRAFLRSCVSNDDWMRIIWGVKRRSDKKCELCGQAEDPAQQLFLDAHPRFDYVDGVQVLRRLVCACPGCQQTIDFGDVLATEQEAIARLHLATVNKWDEKAVEAHIRDAYSVWAERSRQPWTLDLRMVEAAGIVVRVPDLAVRPTSDGDQCEIRPIHDMEAYLSELGLQ